MGIKRIVDTSFWTDTTVLDEYSIDDKYFQLYLMTNPKSAQLGIYSLPKKIISFETGFTKEVVEVLLQRFENDYKNIKYNHVTQEIAVLNYLKYSIVKGGKPVSDLLTKELGKVEDENLIVEVYNQLTEWWNISERNFDNTVKELFEEELIKRKVPKEKLNVNDNDNDNEESYHDSLDDSSESDNDKDSELSTKELEQQLESRFEALWKQYPKKRGKQPAFKSYKKALREDKSLTDEVIARAIEDYKKEIDLKGTNEDFVAYGSTWFNQKRWLDEYEIAQERKDWNNWDFFD
jgi:hypothetical protein